MLNPNEMTWDGSTGSIIFNLDGETWILYPGDVDMLKKLLQFVEDGTIKHKVMMAL